MIPYESDPIGGIALVNGKAKVGVPMASRSRIHKLVCMQTSGAPGGFSVDLFNSEKAIDAVISGSSAALLDKNGKQLSPENFRVMPTLAGTTGKATYFADSGTGGYAYPFFSMDPGKIDQKSQMQQRTLWVLITAAVGTFSLNIGSDAPIL